MDSPIKVQHPGEKHFIEFNEEGEMRNGSKAAMPGPNQSEFQDCQVSGEPQRSSVSFKYCGNTIYLAFFTLDFPKTKKLLNCM